MQADVGIAIGAGVLYQQGILLSPAAGAALMSLSTVIVAISYQYSLSSATRTRVECPFSQEECMKSFAAILSLTAAIFGDHGV